MGLYVGLSLFVWYEAFYEEVYTVDREHRSERFTAIEARYAGYGVYDQAGEKIGGVDDLFVDENDRLEYWASPESVKLSPSTGTYSHS